MPGNVYQKIRVRMAGGLPIELRVVRAMSRVRFWIGKQVDQDEAARSAGEERSGLG